MSIYSDYKVGAISDEEFRNFGVRENRRDRRDRYERECERCSHYTMTVKGIYGCELWNCEYEVAE